MPETNRDSWDEKLVDYRAHWEQHYGRQGARWDEYEAAYRYAWELANTPGIQYGRSWADVEPEFQRGWQTQGSGLGWETVRDLMHDVWDEATSGGSKILEGDQRAPEPEHRGSP